MMSQLYIKSYSACIYSYVKCYYMGYSFEIDGTMVVDQSQFELLMMAVFFDLKNNSTVDGWDKASRRKFDTPFWDFSGNHPGQACFDDVCYENYEVNYFAQGMWTAASGQSKDEGHVIVWLWNFSEYYFDEWKMPHLEGKYYWHDFGYDAYNTLNQIYDNLLLQYGE